VKLSNVLIELRAPVVTKRILLVQASNTNKHTKYGPIVCVRNTLRLIAFDFINTMPKIIPTTPSRELKMGLSALENKICEDIFNTLPIRIADRINKNTPKKTKFNRQKILNIVKIRPPNLNIKVA